MTTESLWRGVWAFSLLGGLGGCPNGSDEGSSADGNGSASSGGDGADGADGDGSAGGSSSSSAGSGDGPPSSCNEDDLSAMYTRYVEPFVSGQMPQSCSQCHMTGVDLSMFAQDTPCDTMACMVSSGLVDLDDPDKSSILAQIQMGNPNSSVFDIDMEYTAMQEWINWSAECHGDVCGEISNACNAGTGANSTGVNPIGDCSEEDLLQVYWNAVMTDRGRCTICHTASAVGAATFGACNDNTDCEETQECLSNQCKGKGPYYAPNTFEGNYQGQLEFTNPADRQLGMNSMYNMAAYAWFDEGNVLDSPMLVKPLLEGFQPLAIYGDGVNIPSVPKDTGVGASHGGTSKFNFDCHMEPCPTEGVVDCRQERQCGGDAGGCGAGEDCSQDGYCRIGGSVCDYTYVNYIRFLEYLASCK